MTRIERTVTQADQAADPYVKVPFDVPEGTTRIDISLSYPKAPDCVIDLGLAEPGLGPFPSEAGLRGWSGGARDHAFVATDDATPGYRHGPIPAGRWHVLLGLYRVPAGGAAAVVGIRLDAADRPVVAQPERQTPHRPGAGWFKGDLHCHTHHSDAAGSPELLHAAARAAGLDFLAVADHNTITQRRYFHPASSPDLVFVRAMEVTTADGHANVFGLDEMVDFRITDPAHVHLLSDLVRRRGGLLSINHDKPSIPWNWPLPRVDCQEVWQSAWLNLNWVSLDRWQARLAAGLRISAIGGSDFHQPDRLVTDGPFALARPTTVLWMDGLSEDGVLDAMRRGRGYVTEGPEGPHLEITVNDIPMGGETRGPLKARAVVRGAAGDMLHWIDATGTIVTAEIGAEDWHHDLALPHAALFLRAEVIARASRPRLVAEVATALSGGRAAKEMAGLDLDARPVLRALSNPVHIV